MKLLRSLLLLAAIAVITLALRDYLGSRDSVERIPLEALPTLSEEIGAQSQSWRWTQSTGDSTRIEVSAADFVQGVDGRETVLRKVVLRIFDEETGYHDRVESAEMLMLESGELFSEGGTVITLGIREAQSSTPVVVHASGVTFEPSANTARTEGPVHYRFPGGQATSVGAHYDAGNGTLSMLSDVHMEHLEDDPDAAPSVLTSGTLVYREAGARVDLSGGVTFQRAGDWMQCDDATIWLLKGTVSRIHGLRVTGGQQAEGDKTAFSAPDVEARFVPGGDLATVLGKGGARFVSNGVDKQLEVEGRVVELHYAPGPEGPTRRLQSIEAKQAVRANLAVADSGSNNTIESEHVLLEMHSESGGIERVETLQRGRLRLEQPPGAGAPLRTLEASSILLRYGLGSRIEGLTATGDATLEQIPGEPGGAVLRTWSSQLEAAFDSGTAAISGIRQQGAFHFEERGDETAPAREGWADEALFDLDGGSLILAGRSSISDGVSRIAAHRITLDRESGRLEGYGRVATQFAPAGEVDGGSMPSFLFAGDRAVYAAADTVVSDPRTGILEYRGGARLWQDRNRIDAGILTLDRETVQLRATDTVRATWIEESADDVAGARPATVEASRMRYEESSGRARFQGSVEFQRDGVRVLSDELTTTLGNTGTEGGEAAVATGTVRIEEFAGRTRGFGSRAEFRLSSDGQVVLSGRPARIVARDGTETRGGSLTFVPAGDRLHVLGQGSERAYTYRPPSE